MQPHYYEEYYAVEESHWWFRARRRILRTVLEREGLWGRGLRAVDVGSGTGRMVEFLAGGMRITATDFEMEALRFAAKRGTASLVQADALRLPFRDASIELLSAFDIIEHLDDDRAALAEFRRVLRPGGYCVATVPAFRSLWSEHDEINHHRHRYRRRELRARFAEAGFTVTRCSYFNSLLFLPVAAFRVARRALARVVDTSRRDAMGRLRSDLSLVPSPILSGPITRLLEAVMGAEARILARADLPVGVSIVCLARREGGAPSA
ncbi:MAG: class I SAM-dependent methyltransferase [Candidatus Rokubacteria bacterium]|nr:class I SAM-dependent methyltransferase [Candidatus Rokubacteria bacterium]